MTVLISERILDVAYTVSSMTQHSIMAGDRLNKPFHVRALT